MRTQVWSKCGQEKDLTTLGDHVPYPSGDGRVRCGCGWSSFDDTLRVSWRLFRQHWAEIHPVGCRDSDPPVLEPLHLFDPTLYDQ